MTQYIPFAITAAYLVIAVVIGFRAGRGHDMNTTEGWGVGSRSMGPIVVYLLVAAGGVSAYTFMGSPGWAHDKGVPALYVVVYTTGRFFVERLRIDPANHVQGWRINSYTSIIVWAAGLVVFIALQAKYGRHDGKEPVEHHETEVTKN